MVQLVEELSSGARKSVLGYGIGGGCSLVQGGKMRRFERFDGISSSWK